MLQIIVSEKGKKLQHSATKFKFFFSVQERDADAAALRSKSQDTCWFTANLMWAIMNFNHTTPIPTANALISNPHSSVY